MSVVVITVHGTPAPQGSKRAFAVRGRGGIPTGRVAVIESSHDRVRSWRQAVVDAALEGAWHAGGWQFTGPVSVRMDFTLARPRSHYRTGKHAGLLRPSAPLYPHRAPDLSKLARATEDALTDAGVWADDALVVSLAATKYYPDTGALRVPGARIEIGAMTWESISDAVRGETRRAAAGG